MLSGKSRWKLLGHKNFGADLLFFASMARKQMGDDFGNKKVVLYSAHLIAGRTVRRQIPFASSTCQNGVIGLGSSVIAALADSLCETKPDSANLGGV
jgi:hypothetical protein